VSKSTHFFQKHTAAVVPTYNLKGVIKTDQTRLEYRVKIRWTLSHKGDNRFSSTQPIKITHSYTAITALGKTQPTVYVCPQEINCAFGPYTLVKTWKHYHRNPSN